MYVFLNRLSGLLIEFTHQIVYTHFIDYYAFFVVFFLAWFRIW
ncbi:hypothetical protein VA7868_03262 [Vibrio aerogenes CECT 7868]|uniref:Uncharacterized protein n=1 Tax=Vibrio aerogenes CECT 7868 TaxID=1216006 RepID=A0A1M5ZUQ9_9VIBR|nr:hypothetical protein VA7868_03262 [Vibrio aerogenes CECT 7868]